MQRARQGAQEDVHRGLVGLERGAEFEPDRVPEELVVLHAERLVDAQPVADVGLGDFGRGHGQPVAGINQRLGAERAVLVEGRAGGVGVEDVLRFDAAHARQLLNGDGLQQGERGSGFGVAFALVGGEVDAGVALDQERRAQLLGFFRQHQLVADRELSERGAGQNDDARTGAHGVGAEVGVDAEQVIDGGFVVEGDAFERVAGDHAVGGVFDFELADDLLGA